MSQATKKTRIFKPAHEEPGRFWLNYILLPYGAYYEKTKRFLEANHGDTMRFFNGPDVVIDSVSIVDSAEMCNFLCRMRYGITFDKAFQIWLRYARLEGHGKDVLSADKCILVSYEDTK